MKRVLAVAATLILTGCSNEPIAPVTSTACAWVRKIHIVDRERAIIIAQAPIAAQDIATHNERVGRACPGAE